MSRNFLKLPIPKEKKMNINKIYGYLSIPLTLSITLSSLVITNPATLAENLPQTWDSKAYDPPSNLGTPGRREPAGTRGNGCVVPDKQIIALVPTNSFGVTTSTRPSFFFYLPAIRAKKTATLDFVLIDDTGDTANDTLLYKTSILTNSNKGGIIKIKLPEDSGLVNLEKNKNYLWKFSLNCSSDTDPGLNFVQGRIRVVEMPPELKNKLNRAQDQDKIALYAGAEIWFDALATAADLRQANPNNSAIEKSWRQLLKAVNLDQIASQSTAKNK
jgi:Domain of Unknown Function (DUF928)